jgi:hypothetical protein
MSGEADREAKIEATSAKTMANQNPQRFTQRIYRQPRTPKTDGTLAAFLRITCTQRGGRRMEFLAKAASIVLSVLVSAFTQVEPMGPAPDLLPEPMQRTVQAPEARYERPVVRLVVLRPPAARPVMDAETSRFLELISRGQTGSKPVARVPWYARKRALAFPGVDEATDVLEAFFSTSEPASY